MNIQEQEIKEGYRRFLIHNVVPLLNLEEHVDLDIVNFKAFTENWGIEVPFVSEYVAILNSNGISKYIAKLQRIIHKNITVLSYSTIVWPEGDIEFGDTFNGIHKPYNTVPVQLQVNIQNVIKLPEWIDNLIFCILGAKYQPSYEKFSYNLDLDVDESKIYLGTYFPRSFAECNFIFNQICNDQIYLSEIIRKKEIRLLDFGCGSGGATLGIIHAIEHFVSEPIDIRIIGIDGNHNSLKLFDRIIRYYNNRGKLCVHLDIVPYFIESEADFNDVAFVIGNNFDIIVSSKAIGELESKNRISQNGYEFFSTLFAPLLCHTGIMVIVDVTTKDEISGLFLPQRMNLGVNRFLAATKHEFKSIAPCSGIIKGHTCRHKCFFKKEIFVSHSEKSKDLTKFAVRILTRRDFQYDYSMFKNVLHNPDCISL